MTRDEIASRSKVLAALRKPPPAPKREPRWEPAIRQGPPFSELELAGARFVCGPVRIGSIKDPKPYLQIRGLVHIKAVQTDHGAPRWALITLTEAAIEAMNELAMVVPAEPSAPCDDEPREPEGLRTRKRNIVDGQLSLGFPLTGGECSAILIHTENA
jgi:hypothetical protein